MKIELCDHLLKKFAINLPDRPLGKRLLQILHEQVRYYDCKQECKRVAGKIVTIFGLQVCDILDVSFKILSC